jgi:hypothetical protein
MTVVNRLLGEDPGGRGPAKELPARRPSADLDKAATGPAISPSGGRPCHTHRFGTVCPIGLGSLDLIGFGYARRRRQSLT